MLPETVTSLPKIFWFASGVRSGEVGVEAEGLDSRNDAALRALRSEICRLRCRTLDAAGNGNRQVRSAVTKIGA